MYPIRVSSPDAEVTVLGNCGIELRIKLLLVQLSQRDCPSCSACWLGRDIVNGDSSLESVRGGRSESRLASVSSPPPKWPSSDEPSLEVHPEGHESGRSTRSSRAEMMASARSCFVNASKSSEKPGYVYNRTRASFRSLRGSFTFASLR
jgi:hypothetical protein